ncbi:MAG: dTDP-4-dehydrorhamnose reductase [Pseudomonadota bacterium]
MRLMLLGQQGQVGWELQRSLAPLGAIMGLDRHSSPDCGDLSRPEDVAETVYKYKPDVVVNAAAYTAVDQAESDVDAARIINSKAPAILAQACHATGALLVHYSTDYVFDGSGCEPRTEGATTGPLNVYGHTKLEGEQGILESGCRHLIFRTSWVYGTRGGNFAKTMLRLAKERSQLSVIDDQVGAPTGADLIADVTAHAIRSVATQESRLGLYHLVASGETTWYQYAQFVIESAMRTHPDAGWRVEQLIPVASDAWPAAAKRPLNSRLDTQQLQKAFGLSLPDWQVGVSRLLNEILE